MVVSRGTLNGSSGSFAGSCVSVVTFVGETAPSVMTVMCEVVLTDSEWDFVEPPSLSFSKKRNFDSDELQRNVSKDSSLS